MKTVSVALVMCLNVGVDPPDVVKTSPCARLECWIGMFVNVYTSSMNEFMTDFPLVNKYKTSNSRKRIVKVNEIHISVLRPLVTEPTEGP